MIALDHIGMRYFKFWSLYDAIKLLKPNYFMAKIHLKHAYRSIPISPANSYYYDTRLQFGAKSSPEIFIV